MTDKNHITTTTVNFRDWILGTGEFSEENLKKARDEFFAKLGKHWSDLMLASMEKALSDLDAVPEARAKSCDDCGPQATPELGNPVLAPPQDGTGKTQEPVAWAVVYPNNEVAVVAFKQRDADELATASDRVVPLYRSPTLTDEEREAVESLAAVCEVSALVEQSPRMAATLHKLLERLDKQDNT